MLESEYDGLVTSTLSAITLVASVAGVLCFGSVVLKTPDDLCVSMPPGLLRSASFSDVCERTQFASFCTLQPRLLRLYARSRRSFRLLNMSHKS